MSRSDIKGSIHFFDIESSLPGNQKSWSPNTLKVRMALNYKQIPYKESFLSYPDIVPFAAHYGIAPDPAFKPPRATLPAILHYDDDNKLIIAMSNSIDIARYLDRISPDRPVLRSNTSEGWTNAVEAYCLAAKTVLNGCWGPGYGIVIPSIPPVLDARGSAWFIEDRQANDEEGRSPLDWGSTDPEEDWAKFTKGLQALVRTMELTTDDAPYLLGQKPCYADFALAGFITWFRRGSEANFKRIIQITGGEGGCLSRHYRECEQWVLGQGDVVAWELPG